MRRLLLRRNLTLHKPFLRSYLWTGRGECVAALPLTYMNRSGSVIPSLMRAARAEIGNLVVICDNMDLLPGTVRLKRRGTSRSHNGLASVVDALGSGDFIRIYVGIGRPDETTRVVEHVLSIPPDSQRALYESAFEVAADAASALLDHDVDTVMSMLANRQ